MVAGCVAGKVVSDAATLNRPSSEPAGLGCNCEEGQSERHVHGAEAAGGHGEGDPPGDALPAESRGGDAQHQWCAQPNGHDLPMSAHATCMLHVRHSIHGASNNDAIDAEATNARVAWFSIGSLFVCIFLAAWQLWYLKVGDVVLQRSLRITLSSVHAELTFGRHNLLRDSVRMLHAALLLKEEATVTLDCAPWGVEEILMFLSGGRTTRVMKQLSRRHALQHCYIEPTTLSFVLKRANDDVKQSTAKPARTSSSTSWYCMMVLHSPPCSKPAGMVAACYIPPVSCRSLYCILRARRTGLSARCTS